MNDAVEEVHRTLKALQPDSDQSKGEEREQVIATTETVKILEALPLISAVSLLIEISVRIEGIVDAVEDLANLADFAADVHENPRETKPPNNP